MTYREPLKMDNVIRAVVAQTGESQRTVELVCDAVYSLRAVQTANAFYQDSAIAGLSDLLSDLIPHIGISARRFLELEAVFVKEMNAEGTRAVAAYMQTMGVANAKPV